MTTFLDMGLCSIRRISVRWKNSNAWLLCRYYCPAIIFSGGTCTRFSEGKRRRRATSAAPMRIRRSTPSTPGPSGAPFWWRRSLSLQHGLHDAGDRELLGGHRLLLRGSYLAEGTLRLRVGVLRPSRRASSALKRQTKISLYLPTHIFFIVNMICTST